MGVAGDNDNNNYTLLSLFFTRVRLDFISRRREGSCRGQVSSATAPPAAGVVRGTSYLPIITRGDKRIAREAVTRNRGNARAETRDVANCWAWLPSSFS